MKDLSFISNTNGLIVTAPADAFPSPACGKVMCPIRGASDPEEPGFTCTPQLVPLGEGPVVFPILVSFDGVANYNGTEWSSGDGPEGVPNGATYIELANEEDGFFFGYEDGGEYTDVVLTIIDDEGNTIIDGEALALNGATWELTVPESALDAGSTYCVVLVFNPVEGGEGE